MKLLSKTSLYYLLLSIPILILSGFICYYVITKEVKDSNNELLLNRKIQVEDYLKNNDTMRSINSDYFNDENKNDDKLPTYQPKKLKYNGGTILEVNNRNYPDHLKSMAGGIIIDLALKEVEEQLKL